jgi:hypothetical protein
MLARTETYLAVAERWLAQLERALSDCDDTLLKTLFSADSHWRDVLALTWRITTVNGRDAIVRELSKHSPRAAPVGFKIPPHRTAPRLATRADIGSIEAIFAFETADGRGSGVVRLKADEESDSTPRLTIAPHRSGKRDHPPPPAADHPRGVRPLCYPRQ